MSYLYQLCSDCLRCLFLISFIVDSGSLFLDLIICYPAAVDNRFPQKVSLCFSLQPHGKLTSCVNFRHLPFQTSLKLYKYITNTSFEDVPGNFRLWKQSILIKQLGNSNGFSVIMVGQRLKFESSLRSRHIDVI